MFLCHSLSINGSSFADGKLNMAKDQSYDVIPTYFQDPSQQSDSEFVVGRYFSGKK